MRAPTGSEVPKSVENRRQGSLPAAAGTLPAAAAADATAPTAPAAPAATAATASAAAAAAAAAGGKEFLFLGVLLTGGGGIRWRAGCSAGVLPSIAQ